MCLGPWAALLYRIERAHAGLSKKTVHAAGREVTYLEGGSVEVIVMIHGFGTAGRGLLAALLYG